MIRGIPAAWKKYPSTANTLSFIMDERKGPKSVIHKTLYESLPATAELVGAVCKIRVNFHRTMCKKRVNTENIYVHKTRQFSFDRFTLNVSAQILQSKLTRILHTVVWKLTRILHTVVREIELRGPF